MAAEAFLTFIDSSDNTIGSEIKIMECEYSFSQITDGSFKPSAGVQGGTINLTVESSRDTVLVEWMIMRDHFKNGKIEFIFGDNTKKLIKFYNTALFRKRLITFFHPRKVTRRLIKIFCS